MTKRIFIFVCFVLFVSSTWASEVCLHLDPKTVCTKTMTDYNYRAEIAVDCDGVDVRFVGYCSNATGTDGTVIENLPLAENNTDPQNTDNRECWCMMLYPVPSKWVWKYAYNKNSECLQSCGAGCKNAMIFDYETDVIFREAVFNTKNWLKK